jgi:hypothetical protein
MYGESNFNYYYYIHENNEIKGSRMGQNKYILCIWAFSATASTT